jgi:hypothetical protein
VEGDNIDLPPEAQAPEFYLGPNGEHRSGPFPFCLPRGYASHNLLPLVRDDAIALFHGLDIPWHAGVDNGPSNHLLDSQVQCVNALMPMVTDPDRLIAALGGILDLGEVRPFPDGTYLTFEYIGDRDYLGESPRKPRRRGTRCTSVDAAFQHTAPDGARELILLEWKYTENYRPDPTRQAGHTARRQTYGKFLTNPMGPIRSELLPLEALFDEPIYQLVRQQLLAHEIEQDPDSGFDRVRVAQVLPAANTAYEMSIHNTGAAALGDTTTSAWATLLAHPNRFLHVPPEAFCIASASGDGYSTRYATETLIPSGS